MKKFIYLILLAIVFYCGVNYKKILLNFTIKSYCIKHGIYGCKVKLIEKVSVLEGYLVHLEYNEKIEICLL